MSVIEIKNLVKKYGDNIAVNDLSLKIEKGKVYGFLGPNGAGKSTTMNIITGYIGATSGTVVINGHDIFKEPEEAKKCFGYLPEIPPLYQEITVKEYLNFVAELKKIPKKDRKGAVEEAVGLARITQVQDKLIKNLSKGYKQRVGIAQAVMGMPEVIILDEPTVGLDPKQIIEIRELIKNLGENHTVILSSHILTEISEVCEHIFIISQGKLVASGTEEELVKELAGDRQIILEVKGKKSEIEDIFAENERMNRVEMEPTEEEGVWSVIVSTDRECDIREELFYLMAENRMPIMSMKLNKKTLEDIFIELTSDYVAPEKKGRRKRKKNEMDTDLESEEEVLDMELKVQETDSKEADSEIENNQQNIEIQEVEEDAGNL